MSNVHNSVETVNAAAVAIANAESRVQPPSEKSRWRSFLSHYWCFGSHKNVKRTPVSTVPRNSASVTDISTQPPPIVLPFIAPPSSPASFLQSDPPSATLSPARIHPVDPSSETASAYVIGPYAHETQLVSPPVFSEFTTQPSTASGTPHPEPIQSTTPSSPEVPFAELLSTSVARSHKTYEANLRFPLSQYDYQPYQSPGSPGSRITSTGYTVPNSGTSSPFTNKPPKSISYDHFARKWGSSRLGSGSLTPNGGGWGSRLGSGTTTPYGDRYIPENEISEVASLANSDNKSENEETIVDHRLSFELTEVVTTNETVVEVEPSNESKSPSMEEAENDSKNRIIINTLKEINTMEEGEEKPCIEKRQSTSLGSSKDFNFDNTKQESLDRSMIDCEWWTNDNRVATEEVQSRMVTHKGLVTRFTLTRTLDLGISSGRLAKNCTRRGRFRPRGNGGFHNNRIGRGRGGTGRGRGGRGSANQGTGRPTCQICNKVGHTAIGCYYRFNSNYSGHANNNRSNSNYSGQSFNYNSQPNASFAPPESASDGSMSAHSGATNHITNDLNSLQLSQSYDGNDTLAFGNGKALPIKHTGQEHVEGFAGKNSKRWTLPDAVTQSSKSKLPLAPN